MSSIYTVSNWVSNEEYIKNSIVRKDNRIYYAATNIPINTEFNTTDWLGYTTVGQETKPNFIWKPSYNSSSDHTPRVKTIQFDDGYEQRIADGINNNLLSLSLSFDLRDLTEARAILHFLYARQGSESFFFMPPPPYETVKKFVCKEWSHNEVFFNNHSIRARFDEKPN